MSRLSVSLLAVVVACALVGCGLSTGTISGPVPPRTSLPTPATPSDVLGPDDTPPTVRTTVPSNGAVNVATNQSLVFTFSEPLDARTVTREGLMIYPHADITFAVAGDVIQVSPTVNWETGRVYTITLATQLTDRLGNRLASPFAMSFTTATTNSPDLTPPMLLSSEPNAGSTSVATKTLLRARFSETLDPATVNADTVKLTVKNGAQVPSTIALENDTVIVKPNGELTEGTVYALTVGFNVKDRAGNPVGVNQELTFTTVGTRIPPAGTDTTRPTIARSSPARDQREVPTENPVITIEFSEPMNIATFDASRLHFASETFLPTTIIVKNSTTVLLIPTQALKSHSTYRVAVHGNVKDLAGNELGAEIIFPFHTK